jgi:hypothetical protein
LAKAINLGELAIAVAIKTAALEQGLNEVKKKLNQHGKDVQKTGADYDKLAIVAGVAFYKITQAISSGVEAYSNHKNALVGLKSEVDSTGQSFGEAQRYIENFISDGLIPATNAAIAYKNLLNRGFGLKEADDMLRRLKDSAAFGKQASLSMGEAIQGATEGLKNENSILVDNAGVTKNVSKMWEEYAATIGKTRDELTLAEKRQAEYTGIMKETQSQVGNAAKYSKEFAGAQARNAAETLKLSQAFGESLVPALNAGLSILTPFISALTNFIKNNQELVAAVTITATVFLGLITAFTAVRAAATLLGPAMAALNASFLALMANPVVLAITAIAGVAALVAIQVSKARKAQEEYNAAIGKHNKLVKEGISRAEVANTQEEVNKLKELAKSYDEANKKYQEFKAEFEKPITGQDDIRLVIGDNATIQNMERYRAEMDRVRESMKALGATEQNIAQKIAEKETAIKEANRVSLEEYNTQAKSIAQKRTTVIETQNLIKAYKTAQQGSREWHDAQQKLGEIFPQFASNSGIAIDAIENVTNAQDAAVKVEWRLLQEKIRISRIELQNLVATKEANLKVVLAENQALKSMGSDAGVHSAEIAESTQNLYKLIETIDTLKKDIKGMNEFEGLDIDKMMGVKLPKLDTTGSDTYANKALDDALKILDHRKRMNMLSLEEEQSTLEKILGMYARNADERMSIEERIFDVKQALRERDKQEFEKAMQEQEEALSRRYNHSQNWIDTEKMTGNLDTQGEIDAYNRIIKYHKEYLAKIMADDRISATEKRRIEEQSLGVIRENERKIFEIRKSSNDKAISEYIESNRKKLEQEEKLELDSLSKRRAAIEKEYNDKIRAMDAESREADLDSLYAQERKFRNAATKEGQDKLRDIRDQIAQLEEEGERERLEREKEGKIAAIEDEVSATKDKYTKLREALEQNQKEMLAASAKYTKEATDQLVQQNNTIADAITNIIRTFDKNTNDLISSGLGKLRDMVDEYKGLMAQVTANNSNTQLAGSGGINVSAAGNTPGSKTVVINDYGDKNINSKDDAVDYTQELMNSAQNALRGMGGG